MGVGSNLGDRMAHFKAALEALGRLPHTQITAVSSIYETEPVCSEGPWFYNGVVKLSTTLSPENLMEACLQIEAKLGRVRSHFSTGSTASPRTIDLDILLYGEQILRTAILQIPHPRMHERAFVLIPMAEIAPTAWHPALKKTIAELRDQLKDPHEVKRFGGC
jgi:2-amino-4-hydroxy-6-hydroxymethyldihydropteridine diphosphokinase